MTDALKVYGPVAAGLLILLIIIMRFIAPPPPMEIRFAAGGVDGQYYALAEQYAEALGAHGIEVEVLETAGTVENFALLKAGDADVALLQGGIASDEDREGLLSLGGMFAEPFWVFARADLVTEDTMDFGNLKSARIAAGAEHLALGHEAGIDEIVENDVGAGAGGGRGGRGDGFELSARVLEEPPLDVQVEARAGGARGAGAARDLVTPPPGGGALFPGSFTAR